MDPKACLRNLLQAISSGYPEDTTTACNDLAEWIKKGGALPTQDDLSELCHEFRGEVEPTPKRVRAAFMGAAPPHADATAGTTPLVKPHPGWPFRPAEKPAGTLPHR